MKTLLFRLNIESANEAFQDRPGAELSRILGATSAALQSDLNDGLFSGQGGPVRDSNGNTVGSYFLRVEET
jgi:hypothetical protein